MKIALIGYGKMGTEIARLAQSAGHELVAIVSPQHGSITDPALADAEICIDFSRPECVLSNLHYLAKAKKNIVMGTTGWYDSLSEVRKIVTDNNIGFIYAPNFSLGVSIFLQIVARAAALFSPFDYYDVTGLEIHHNQKLDSPSGTAKAIAQSILDNMERKNRVLYELPERPIAPDEMQFASLRSGATPGTHTVIFDSPADTITLSHVARNRQGFASGALIAAEWIKNKQGFFTFEEMLYEK